MKELDEKLDELLQGTKTQFERLEKSLYYRLVEYLSTSLNIRENRIEFTPNNLNVIQQIDSLMSRFSLAIQRIGNYIVKGIREMMGLTVQQLAKIDIRAEKLSKEVISDLTNHSATVVNKRLSLETLFLDIKQSIISQVQNPDGVGLKEIRDSLFNKVVGDKLAQRYFGRWTYDVFSQIQRVGANQLRIKLGLRFAIYQGGLIKTSRPFCEEKNGQCFLDEEIGKWVNEDFEGKPETGYQPFVDLGGYNCRHRLDWISKELAKRLRPDLFISRPELFV